MNGVVHKNKLELSIDSPSHISMYICNINAAATKIPLQDP